MENANGIWHAALVVNRRRPLVADATAADRRRSKEGHPQKAFPPRAVVVKRVLIKPVVAR
jgi:hypothetical protein